MSADMSAITQAAAVTELSWQHWQSFAPHADSSQFLASISVSHFFWLFFFRGFLREILETLTTKRMRQRLMGDCGCQGRNKGGTKGERDCCSFIFELLDRS